MSGPFIAPVGPHSFGLAVAEIDTAHTTFDKTSGTIVEVYQVPATEPRGIHIQKIVVKAHEATTAGQVKLFLSPDGGTTWWPWKAILVSAITPAAGVLAFEAQLDEQNDEELAGGFMLPTGWSIGAATHNSEDMSVFVAYGVN